MIVHTQPQSFEPMTTNDVEMLRSFVSDALKDLKSDVRKVGDDVTDVRERVTRLETEGAGRTRRLRNVQWLIAIAIPAIPIGLALVDRFMN